VQREAPRVNSFDGILAYIPESNLINHENEDLTK
jgi:hypothetical protein